MIAAIANSVGLVASILGVGLVFFFGYPQPSHDQGVSIVLTPEMRLSDGLTLRQYDQDVRDRNERRLGGSRLGLVLMAFGFVLQLVAIWVG